MSVKVMSWVWDHSGASGNDRLVLLAIADHCDHDGRNAWPKVETLAKKVKADERSVRRSIKRLIELGELEVEDRAGRQMGEDNPRHRSHLYKVVMTGQDARSEPDGRPDNLPGQVTGQSARSKPEVDRAECPLYPDNLSGQVTGQDVRSIEEPSEGPLTVLEPSLTAPAAPQRGAQPSGPALAKATAAERNSAKAARGTLARSLVTDWWDERKAAGDPPAQRFPAVVCVIDGVLANGVPAEAVAWALRQVPTVSGGAIQMALSRRNGRGRTSTTDTAMRMIREASR